MPGISGGNPAPRARSLETWSVFTPSRPSLADRKRPANTATDDDVEGRVLEHSLSLCDMIDERMVRGGGNRGAWCAYSVLRPSDAWLGPATGALGRDGQPVDPSVAHGVRAGPAGGAAAEFASARRAMAREDPRLAVPVLEVADVDVGGSALKAGGIPTSWNGGCESSASALTRGAPLLSLLRASHSGSRPTHSSRDGRDHAEVAGPVDAALHWRGLRRCRGLLGARGFHCSFLLVPSLG